jgi:chromosome segregation ATPase
MQENMGKLKMECEELNKSIADMSRENNILQKNINEFSQENCSLRTNINDFAKRNSELLSNINNLSLQNAELQGKIAKLDEQNAEFAKQNSEFGKRNEELVKLNAEFDLQTKKLQKAVAFSETNRAMLEGQIKELMSSLSENGDKFVNFNEILSNNINKSATTAEMMNSLLSKLGDTQFANIDKDGDGAITKEELIKWAENS